MPHIIDTKAIVLTAITALTAQEVRFSGYVDWFMFQNDSPSIVTILREDGVKVLAHVLPGDVKPVLLGRRQVNTIRLFANAVSLAADIADGNILYIDYCCRAAEA